mgnify:CR=1 FL=1
MDKHIEIYTDGACLGNPGAGGYGIVLKYKQFRKELSQGYQFTTNNRMELLAVIVALESLKEEGLKVSIYSDSKYVVDAVSKGWIWNWQRQNFKDKKNEDLWRRFLKIYPKHELRFHWLKGHAGHAENERCDALAVAAAKGHQLLEDTGFTKSNP